MVSADEAARLALDLPEVTQGDRYGNRTWSVAGTAKAFFTIAHFDGYSARADVGHFRM